MRHGRALALSYFVLISVVLHVQGYGVVTVLSQLTQRRRAHEEARERARQGSPEQANSEPVELVFDDAPQPSAEPSAEPSSPSEPTPSAAPSARRRRDPAAAPERVARSEPVRPRDPTVSQLELVPPPQRPSSAPPPPPNMQMQSVDQQLETQEARPNDPAFLAQSNHDVSEQTIAALRSLTARALESQLAPSTQPRQQTPGDGSEQRSADDRDHAGNPEQTPNEGPRPTATPAQASAARANEVPGAEGPRGAAGMRGAAGAPGAASLAAMALDRSRVLTGLDAQSFQIPSGGGAGTAARAADPLAAGRNPGGSSTGSAGQGGAGGQHGAGLAAAQRVGVAGRGATATLRTLSPTHATYAQVFGSEAHRERVEAQLRRSRARGGGYAESFRENREAIENFTPTVRVGNQTALRTAASPFAAYLTAMHRRIHRHFADGFLAGIENAPPGSPFADPTLVTQLEISLERDGRIARLGVVRTSGNMAFDVAALNSVRRGAPYGSAPDAIVSGDGRVYVRWGFYRGERQCGTFNAEPFVLPTPGAAPPPLRPPPRGSASDHSLRALPVAPSSTSSKPRP